MLTESKNSRIPLLLVGTFLVAFNLQDASAEPPSVHCLNRWGFAGVYAGMHKSEFKSAFPEAERLKRPWREKTYRVLVENPIAGINIGAGEMIVELKKRRVSTIRFEPERISQLDALLRQLEQRWGRPYKGIVDGAVLILKGAEASEEIDTGLRGIRTLSWTNDCGIDVSLYLDDPPYFWAVED